jgi:hypothetical protein
MKCHSERSEESRSAPGGMTELTSERDFLASLGMTAYYREAKGEDKGGKNTTKCLYLLCNQLVTLLHSTPFIRHSLLFSPHPLYSYCSPMIGVV